MATNPSWVTPLLFNPKLNNTTENTPISGIIPKTISQSGSAMDFNITPNSNNTIERLSLLSNKTTDTSITPEITKAQEDLAKTKSNILDIGKRQITSEDLSRVSSLRPENSFESDLRIGVDKLKDYSSGNSLVDRTIANRLLTQSGAMQSASNISQAQKIASNPMLSTAAKTAGMMELNRTAGAQRSELVGKLAEQSQERAYTATKDYAQLSLDASKYNEEKYKTDLAVITDQFSRELNAVTATGNIDIASLNNTMDTWKTNIDTQLRDVSNSIQANVAIGNMTQEDARLAWEKQKTEIDESFRLTELSLRTKETDANIAQMKEATASLHDGRISTLRTTAINSVSNLRMVDSSLSSEKLKEKGGLAYNQIQDAYRLEIGDENATPTDDYINTIIQQARTPAEMESAITNDTLNSWKASGMVAPMGSVLKPGQMSEETFNGLAQVFKTASLTNNTIHINDSGTVDILNADGTTYAQVGTDGVYRKASELGINTKTPQGISIPPEVQKDKTKEWVSEDGSQVLKLDSSGEAIEVPHSIVSSDGKTIISTPKDKIASGSLWKGNDNLIYETNSSGDPIQADLSNPKPSQLSGLSESDPIVQQAIKTFDNPSKTFENPQYLMDDTGLQYRGKDEFIKIKNTDGNYVLVKYVSDSLGVDGKPIMNFVTTDNKKINIVSTRRR